MRGGQLFFFGEAYFATCPACKEKVPIHRVYIVEIHIIEKIILKFFSSQSD